MSTNHIYFFEGTTLWSALDKPDKFNKYTIDVCLDDKSQAKYAESGLSLKEVFDEKTGKKFIRFKRAASKLIKNNLVELGKPKVIDTNGNTFNGRVNVGSSVAIKVTVYNTEKGFGHTLEAVKVLELNGSQTVVDEDYDLPF